MAPVDGWYLYFFKTTDNAANIEKITPLELARHFKNLTSHAIMVQRPQTNSVE